MVGVKGSTELHVMSEKGEAVTRRESRRRSLADTALPPQYLEELEEKRKQLDESIHKYIAAKEREFKVFEKELKHSYKIAQGQNGTNNGHGKRRASPESTQDGSESAKVDAPETSAVDALLATSASRDPNSPVLIADEDGSRAQDRSPIAGLKDSKVNLEREKEFVGLFTPTYIHALNGQTGRKVERTTSAPAAVPPLSKPDGELDKDASLAGRINSDSALQATPKRPSHLALAHRNSSSGSSVEGKLASALKSPTQRSKRKRVSLAVGDSIVAPSDSVPLGLSSSHAWSHSRIKAASHDSDAASLPKRDSDEATEDRSAVESLPAAEATATSVPYLDEDESGSQEQNAAALAQPSLLSRTASPKTIPIPSKIDPDGDLFGLEEESELPNTAAVDDDDLDESALESEDEVTGRVDFEDTEPAVTTPTGERRYDPTTGWIPEPANSEDSAVPSLAIGPGSAVASQQPTNPGFRRPSVVDDPVYRGENYTAAEQHAVENDVYGSSFNRPSTKGSFTAGSLGESYMERNAEKMKMARQQTHAQS